MSLSVNNLTVRLPDGRSLVNNLSFEVQRGQTLALLGASGSGKSVTCTAVLGLLSRGLTAEGDIRLDGTPVDFREIRGRRVACIMQNPASAFNPVYTMEQHATETMKAVGLAVDMQVIHEALSDAGLDDHERVLGLYPFQMSGGMLQRMMLALALLTPADYLIADEPTTDLDLIVQGHILNRVEHLARKRNLGVLLVTHDLGVVARLADHVVVMAAGDLVEACDVEQLFDQPSSDAAKALLSAHYSLYAESVSESASVVHELAEQEAACLAENGTEAQAQTQTQAKAQAQAQEECQEVSHV